MGWENIVKKYSREIEITWEAVKRNALNRLSWRRSVSSQFRLRLLGTPVNR